ncbi:MAG: hypothetical protein DHS80DRAFT_22772 [Piptocephalis tieghemiana]|nr:MAG: hypothetical protein DHS80DRAFT_22772 [Piptocephalis tieghemiana]
MVERTRATYSAAQVASHSDPTSSVWVVYKGGVYDVTSFLEDHPGGDDLILDYAGQDISSVMDDLLSHVHSDGAYELLETFRIGDFDPCPKSLTSRKASTCAFTSSSSSSSSISTSTTSTSAPSTSKEDPFLDLNQALFPQMWRARFSKAFYLEQVHKPRHLPQPAILFGHPLLEPFSMTPWWVIPLVWLPVAWVFYRWAEASLGPSTALSWYVAGLGLWTLIEYLLHRFVFHLDDLVPDYPICLLIHFVLHGVHHYLPMDRMRLVMPPALAAAIATSLYNTIVCSLFPVDIARALMAGLLTGYVMYDLTHYYLHHGKPITEHLRSMKTYHVAHHYKDFHSGYGITQKWWDRIFNTVLEP